MVERSVEWYGAIQWNGYEFGMAVTEAGLKTVVLPYRWVDHPARLRADSEARARVEPYIFEFEAYWAGRLREWTLPIDWSGTPFQQAVWRKLLEIPWGSTATYGQVAHMIGRPTAVRAVARAVGDNPLPIVVPCHRVIGANGTLTGYRGGLALKQELLAHEGITGVRSSGHARFAF